MHPYHYAWREAGASHDAASPPPSIFGALPSFNTSLSPFGLTKYHITAFAPTLLDSKVAGPQGEVYFNIETDKEMLGYTTIKDSRNSNIGLIEWKSTSPMVEIKGILLKQSAKNWLELSSDCSTRRMDIRGVQYIWATHNQAINVHAGTPSGTVLASVSRTTTSISIEMTADALQLQLLEGIIVAVILLQCGRNID